MTSPLSNNKDSQIVPLLLTTTMPKMKETVGYCKKNYPDIKVVVGGAPVTESFAAEINADAYGEDASRAPEIINRFLN